MSRSIKIDARERLLDVRTKKAIRCAYRPTNYTRTCAAFMEVVLSDSLSNLYCNASASKFGFVIGQMKRGGR